MKIASKALPSSEAFQANRKAHLEALAQISEAAELAAAGGGEKARERHVSRGKMLPRERVANLLDPGAPFLEVGATAAHGLYGGAAPCAGMIAGVGRVEGREVMVVCNDATVKGGTCARRRSPRNAVCPASTLSTAAGRTCRTRTRSSPTGTISDGSSTTRHR